MRAPIQINVDQCGSPCTVSSRCYIDLDSEDPIDLVLRSRNISVHVTVVRALFCYISLAKSIYTQLLGL